MKTILRFVVALSSVVALPAAAALNVFACEPEWSVLAQELGGDKVSVYSATTALQDAHRIEARPSLIARIRSTDLLICSGSELEIGWIPGPQAFQLRSTRRISRSSPRTTRPATR